MARQIILRNCTTCHGLGPIVAESEDRDKWFEILEEMAKRAARRGMPNPSQGQEVRLVAFLSSLNPADADESEEDGGRRGRGRGRAGSEDD